MPRAILKSKFFKSSTHVANHIRYINRQSQVFTLDGETPVKDALVDVEKYKHSQTWRQVYAPKKEDLERLGVDREYFKQLLQAKRVEIARAYNISPDKLRVVASFHEKDHHPHLHMVMYSTDSREGHLHVHKDADKSEVMNRASVRLKSVFTNEIFRNDLEHLKVLKGGQRDMLYQQLKQDIERVTQPNYPCDKQLVAKLKTLGSAVNRQGGKKAYGFMPPAIKEQVDDVLRHIMAQDAVAGKLFAHYGQTQHQLVLTYAENRETVARKMQKWEQSFFSPQKGEDTARHNMIIRAASKLGAMSNKEKNGPVGEYQEKTPTAVAQSLLYQLGRSMAAAARQNEARNDAQNPPARKNQKLRKKTHSYSREDNGFDR